MLSIADDINEKELFSRIAEGDEIAFRDLYQAYAVKLFRFLVKLTGSEANADEIIQETFLRVWLHRDTLNEVEYPKAWLFRIASNQSQTWLKKNLLTEKTDRAYGLRTTEAANTVEHHVDLHALQVAVEKAIAEMPEQRRKIYLLHREEGMKAADIAAELDISLSTVKSTLQSATKHIRDSVGNAGYLYWLVLFFIKS